MFTLNDIKADLKALTEIEFITKYYLKSYNWYLSKYLGLSRSEEVDIMDNIRIIISKNLNIGFNNIVIIGSSKVGYSISPTDKLFAEFRIKQDNPSDIDIAIISEKHFYELWDSFRELYSVRYNVQYNHYAKDIFRGFINEKTFSEIDEIRGSWDKKVDKINDMLVTDFGFEHQIKYRIYRGLDDLMDYQIRGLREIKEDTKYVF